MSIRILGGFKEVVDGCVCYYASEGHEHLFSYRKHMSQGPMQQVVFLYKVPTGGSKGVP